MTCERIDTPQGTIIACTRGANRTGRRKCAFCTFPAKYVCDWPTGAVAEDGKPATCDKPLCAVHARYAGKNKCHCVNHPEQATTNPR
jgi:hypothetical protein